jgi:hypothetical protein
MIEAIKSLRAATGLGIVKIKVLVDRASRSMVPNALSRTSRSSPLALAAWLNCWLAHSFSLQSGISYQA